MCLGSFQVVECLVFMGLILMSFIPFFLGFSVLTGLTSEKFKDTTLDHSLIREFIVP